MFLELRELRSNGAIRKYQFIKKEEIKIIRKNFDKITYEFNLSQTDLELVNINELQEKKNPNIKTILNYPCSSII